MRRYLAASVALLGFLAPAAQAAPAPWATVNVCDAPGADNVVGVRASMPGNGGSGRMYMHFAAEWFSFTKQQWTQTGSSSRWIAVGPARWRAGQAGFNLEFGKPPENVKYMMRGVVRYEWRVKRRKRWVAVKRARRYTEAGHPGTPGAVPAHRSDAVCVISP